MNLNYKFPKLKTLIIDLLSSRIVLREHKDQFARNFQSLWNFIECHTNLTEFELHHPSKINLDLTFLQHLNDLEKVCLTNGIKHWPYSTVEN